MRKFIKFLARYEKRVFKSKKQTSIFRGALLSLMCFVTFGIFAIIANQLGGISGVYLVFTLMISILIGCAHVLYLQIRQVHAMVYRIGKVSTDDQEDISIADESVSKALERNNKMLEEIAITLRYLQK